MSEKSITRYFTPHGEHHEAEGGFWVKHSDHQQALGEAEAAVAAEEQHRLEVQRACIAANQKLQAITAGLEAEVERLRKEAAGDSALADESYDDGALNTATRLWAKSQTTAANADRIKELLDQAETAGAE